MEEQSELGLLDVNFVEQEKLEKDLNTKLNQTITANENELDEKRLEKARKKLAVVQNKIDTFQRRLNNSHIKISEKTFVTRQIRDLEERDKKQVQEEIEEVMLRQRQRLDKFNAPEVLDETERLPDETENDYLMRTGKITGFGNSSSFKLANGQETVLDNGNGIKEISDDEYVEEIETVEEPEEESVGDDIESLKNIDDGDESLYQRRIKELKHKFHNEYLVDSTFADAVLNLEFKVPGQIYANLFDYQKTCVQWLWELYSQKVGGIIGDEMGLGKTIQIIAFLASLFYSGKLTKPVLIVCPSTVMRQWVSEFHTWWPAFRVMILHAIGSGMLTNRLKDLNSDLYELVEDEDEDNRIKKQLASSSMQEKVRAMVEKVFKLGHVVITTYAGLKIYSKHLLKHSWGYVVLDEGHKIRNPNAEVSLTAKRLRTPHRIILSGTPIQNNLTELWSLFDFVYPGKLGTLPIFQTEFVVPINMGGYANASNMQVQTSLNCAVALKNLITPYLLRRLKTDVAKDLPKKTEMVLFCKLTQYQEKKYLDFLKSTDTSSILDGRKHALYGIDILKKICNHPDLLLLNNKQPGEITKKRFGDPVLSGKLQVLKALISLWKSEGHKILLFTQTKQMLNILESFTSHLEDGSVNYLRMDGSTPIKIRQELMDEFNNNPDIHVFLLTTRVGGLGVNLIGADRVIIFDPDWNPSTDIQARERAWRLGQKKDVVIYRLMTKGTIEEKIYQRQIFKQFLSNKVLKDPNQKRVFKMNELNDLFTYGDEDGEGEVYSRNPRMKPRNKNKTPSKQSDNFEEVAKISGIHALEKFNTGEGDDQDQQSKSQSAKEEDRVLGNLLENTGIKASLQSDDVGISPANKGSIIQREAEKIAAEAVKNLKASRTLARQKRIGVPTWTGKFGSAGRVVKKSASKNSQFSSAALFKKVAESVLAPPVPEPQQTPYASKNFNAELVNKKEDIIAKVQSYLELQNGRFAKSADIMSSLNINLVNDADIKLVRTILREIASWSKEKSGWVLKEEFWD